MVEYGMLRRFMGKSKNVSLTYDCNCISSYSLLMLLLVIQSARFVLHSRVPSPSESLNTQNHHPPRLYSPSQQSPASDTSPPQPS